MNLFQLGVFNLHAGQASPYKIDCDALTDADLDCIAYLLAERLQCFGSVEGVPTGGVRLAFKMEKYITTGPLLIVDDVMTTGTSLQAYRQDNKKAIGAVIFARGTELPWVTPLFTMSRQ